jgi:hypothetical protein
MKLALFLLAGATTSVALATTAPSASRPHPKSNPASPLMLAGDWVPANPHQIDFDRLPRIPSRHVTISSVLGAGGHRVNQHNYLAFHAGRFWAMWSDGPGESKGPGRTPGHDRPGQRVSFATSRDGLEWSAIGDLSGPPDPDHGWIARGFWLRDGQMLALASRFKAPNGAFGEGLSLEAFELAALEPPRWRPAGRVFDDALNNFPPQRLPTGEWMMSRRDGRQNVHFLLGGTAGFDRWTSHPVLEYATGDFKPEEPYWWVLPDGNLVALFRDNQGSGYLYRSFSTDHGRSWTQPIRTNFPDARAKFNGLRLPDGRYILVSNPRPKKRDPLALSISDDGLVFTAMGWLAGGRSVDYPHVIQHEQHLYIAFATTKQTVEVLQVRISDLAKIDNRAGTAGRK